jgi:GntR family transcriptional regulator, histidine utilization repressor
MSGNMTCAKAAPLYVQLQEHVLQNIRSGEWRPGARVPSEHELVSKFNVSRMTANRALRELMRSGVLARIAGVGTFVGDLKAAAHPLQIRNIAQEIRDRGHRHRALPVTLESTAPTDFVRSRLRINARTLQVFHSLIVHFEDDVALQVEDRYVNPLAAPDYLSADFTAVTPNEYLMEVAPLQRVEHVVRAVQPAARIRGLLKLQPREPALLIERVTWSGAAPASFALLYHPGARFELRGSFEV